MKNNTEIKVFIVDDDTIWTKLLSQQLKNQGYHDIETFSNGDDCLDSINKNPAVIFLDYQMESEDGLSVLKRIKTYDENIPVIFCTSYEDLGVALSAIAYGSLDYLLKTNLNETELDRLLTSIK